MAHPKHKASKQRRDKRRTHDVAVCLRSLHVQTAVQQSCTTEYAQSVATTEVVRSLRRKPSNRFLLMAL